MRSTEKVYLPENATVPPSWNISKDMDYVVIEFPSKTTNEIYNVIVERSSRLMGCTCIGFNRTGICSHIKKLKWILKKMGRSTKAVSLEAKLSLTDEYMTAIKLKILEILKEKPKTVDEIEEIMFNPNNPSNFGKEVGQRVSDLYKEGWIEPTGETRPTRRGRSATVWEIS